MFTFCAHTCSIGCKSGDNTGHGSVWTLMGVDSVLSLATYDSVSTNGERFTDPCVAEIDRWGWTKSRSCSLTLCKDVVAGFLCSVTLAKCCTQLCFHSLLRIKALFFQQDNAQAHAAKLTQKVIATKTSRHYHGLRYHLILT